jgi:hypothetical protein
LGWYSNHSGWNPDPKRSCLTSAIEKNKIKSEFSWELNGFSGQGHDGMTHQSLSLFPPTRNSQHPAEITMMLMTFHSV